MFVLMILAASIAAVYAEESKINERFHRAVGSDDAKIHHFPYTASIHLYNKTTHRSGFVCGAFIVSKINLVTACHCVKYANGRVIRVRVGSSYYDKEGELIDAKNTTCHPEYKLDIFSTRDIAVIELPEPLTYGPTIQKIELYSKILGIDEELNKTGLQIGWGYSDRFYGDADVLQALELPIISKRQCKAYFQPIIDAEGKEAVYDDQMCAGVKTDEITKSACYHDSGSPLAVLENNTVYAIGITADVESPECDRPTYPNIFTEIAYFLPWIKGLITEDAD